MQTSSSPIKSLTAGVLLLLAATPATLHADNHAYTFAFTLENDVFGGTDRSYTNGARFTWDFADAASYRDIRKLPSWARTLSRLRKDPEGGDLSYGASIAFGQNMYTPGDIAEAELIPDDRPYAGWTYLSLALRKNGGAITDTFEMTLGVVGPSSYAEEIQDWVHESIDSQDPQGWDNQLNDEIGLILSWQREQKLLSWGDADKRWGGDVGFSYGATLGNIYTHAQSGLNLRFGLNRNASLSPPRLRPGASSGMPTGGEDVRLDHRSNRSGFFISLGGEGRYVARNLFVEGNTWSDSHGLDAAPWVSDIYAGATLLTRSWSFSYVYTRRSPEFDEQRFDHEFAGVTIARSF